MAELVMPSLVQYSDDEVDGAEEKKEAEEEPKKKKEKKKKKKKKKDKGKKKKAESSSSALPSAEDLMSSNALPDFLEEAQKRAKEDALADLALSKAKEVKDAEEEKQKTANSSGGLSQEQIEAIAKAKREKAAARAAAEKKMAKAAPSRKRPYQGKGRPDPFDGLHPWADGAAGGAAEENKRTAKKEGRAWANLRREDLEVGSRDGAAAGL
eukprot:CAMPEP_0170188470 /NCGR_PEP_ID=MMETSP0040_2-20121228/44451_1 /TAXON_ID=641309 /ORGANISM="Lotharella oceanica, Strain CCMP622" /LENGTH=210 /DNA_ID=CAMNT_0010435783 /DNA_START=57 /DNA_END=688 /DNA_ORIENTATION=-